MTTSTAPIDEKAGWVEVCPAQTILLDTGVTALVDGHQVAVFRLAPLAADSPTELYAIDNIDPFTGVPVMSRGLIGSKNDEPTVAAPLYKQQFSLVTGRCFDDETVQVTTWPVTETDGIIYVASPSLHTDETWP